MLRGYRFRIYPTKRERKELNRQMFLAKDLYNLLLEKAKSHYKETKKTFTRNMMNKWITNFKKENKEFDALYSQVVQNVSDRVSKAYKNFFNRVKERKFGKKIKAGCPRPKIFVQSITYPQSGFEIVPERKRIEVSNIGYLHAVFDRGIKERIKTLTIKKTRSAEWYASTIASVEDKPFLTNGKAEIGIDLGLNSYATLSNGEKISNPKAQEKYLQKLRRCHKRISRRKKGGSNRRDAVSRLAKISEHISRQREDYLHKLSRNLVNSYSFIAYERLNIKNMLKNHHLARGISSASWGSFIQMLCYKAESAGCRVVGINPMGTTKECSSCGKIKSISLSERTYSCASCGMVIDRDINAAINILNKATAGHAESHASGDMVTTSGSPGANRVDETGTIYGENAIGNRYL